MINANSWIFSCVYPEFYTAEDDLLLTRSRLALAETVQKLIGIGLKIIGVQPLDKLN